MRLREAAGPALSANRTMGSLGGVVASRIAREFRIGGPSFTVSCDETSGIQAMAVAVDWLRGGELDAAIVGAVEFAGDDRASLAQGQLGGRHPDGQDSAFCLVLKRLDHARRNGDPVYALIRDIATATDGVGVIGESGAATGLAEVVRRGESDSTIGFNPRPINRPGSGCETAPKARVGRRSRSPIWVERLRPSYWRKMRHPRGRHRASRRPPGCADQDSSPSKGTTTRRSSNGSASLIKSCREHPDESIDAMARRLVASPPRRSAVAAGAGDRCRWCRIPPKPPGCREKAGIRPPRHDTSRGRASSTRDWVTISKAWGGSWASSGPMSCTDRIGRTVAPRPARGRGLVDRPAPAPFTDHRTPILGQVAVGSLVTDVLLGLGIAPDAAIGYSMGESAALVALRAWTNRDELSGRLQSSPLFATQLSGPCEAARRAWGIPPDRPVPWVAGIVPEVGRRCERGDRGLRERPRLRPDPERDATRRSSVASGAPSVDVVSTLSCQLLELPAVSTVHCEIGRLVESHYEALHDIDTAAPPRIAFYSGVSGRRYAVDRRSAARAIAAQASQTIDFPRTIENAYADGIGLFIEVGPGSSCTRLIDRILGDRPHVAVSACRPDRDSFAAVLDVLAACVGHRVPVNLSTLYGDEGTGPAKSRLGRKR